MDLSPSQGSELTERPESPLAGRPDATEDVCPFPPMRIGSRGVATGRRALAAVSSALARPVLRGPTSRRAVRAFAILVAAALGGILAAGCRPSGTVVPAFTPVVEPLPSPAGPASGQPNLATSGSTVYLSWLEKQSEEGHALLFARWDGSGWNAPQTIASELPFFVNWADFPSLLAMRDGTLVAHWLQKSGEDTYSYDVKVSVSTDGGASWSPPVSPHRDGTPTEHGFVSLVDLGPGRFGAFWLDGRKFHAAAEEDTVGSAERSGSTGGQGGTAPAPGEVTGAGGQPSAGHDEHAPGADMALMFALYEDGAFRPEEEVDPRACECCQTAAVAAGGGLLVAYRDRSASEIRDISLARGRSGAWSAPRGLHDDGWEITGCPVNGPSLAADGDRIAAAWYTEGRGEKKVLAAFSSDGGQTFGAPLRFDQGQPLGRVDVEWAPGGSALVVWLEQGEGTELRARQVWPDGSMDDPFALAPTVSARSSGFPRLVRAGDALYVAWTAPGEPPRVQFTRIASDR